MYPKRIPLDLIIMYRALHLMEYADKIEMPFSEPEEASFWKLAEMTIDRHYLDEDFLLFPCFDTLTGTGSTSSNTNSGAFLPSKYANVY